MKYDLPKSMGYSKTVLRITFIAIEIYLENQEKYQIIHLILHLKELRKGEQMKPKVSRGREIIKLKVEIYEMETK